MTDQEPTFAKLIEEAEKSIAKAEQILKDLSEKIKTILEEK